MFYTLQPDDPFFTLGDIIVTTYDQVLSGLLCSPYGQSPRQHNVNAAALTRSAWMTATATKPPQLALQESLDVAEVSLSADEERLPAKKGTEMLALAPRELAERTVAGGEVDGMGGDGLG